MSSEDSKARWIPLEGNPEVMNTFVHSLGVPEKWKFVDVFGLEDKELLAMVPKPVLALLLLFPIDSKYEDYCKEIQEKVKDEAEKLVAKAYYMKQTISNACGTIGLIHSIANNKSIELADGSVLDKFLKETASLSPEERGASLEKNVEISKAHGHHAQQGQTAAPNPEENVNLHFVSLVNVDGTLVELDGRKEFPIPHNQTSSDTFLEDAAKVCSDYMKRNPDEVRFIVIALTGGDEN